MIERICYVHNHYQRPGGEDVVFAAESALMESRGLAVERFVMHNRDIDSISNWRKVSKTIWNRDAHRALGAALRRSRSQVAHFHNTFPLISPAGYDAARDAGVPVVQTLHNYRLLCPNALMLRDGRPCESCVGKTAAWPGVVHACYRGSRAATGVVAGMTAIHRMLGTWKHRVDGYIALTDFGRDLFVRGGLPPERVFVKPNFVLEDPGFESTVGDYALFVGRLSQEKGVAVLRRAWELIGGAYPLKVVGEGPLESELAGIRGIECLGQRPRQEVALLMKGARVLLFPSTWYEGFPMVLAEAFAAGLPVIASRLGSAASIITNGVTGYHFVPGNPESLAECISEVWPRVAGLRAARQAARKEYEEKYTPGSAYDALMKIYQQVASV